MTRAKLKLAYERPPERIYGSDRFIAMTRQVGAVPPTRFEPTVKQPQDIII